MKFHQEDVVNKARKLKKEGISATEIGKRFGLRSSTILRWCNDILSNDPRHICSEKLKTDAKNRNFKKLFRLGFQPKEDKLRIRLQLHSTHDREKVESLIIHMERCPNG